MKLTTLTRDDKEVKERIKLIYKNQKVKLNEMKCLPLTLNYDLVGTAFDYCLRFYLEYNNKNKKIIKYPWVASDLPDYEEVINECEEHYKKIMQTGNFTDESLASIINLAQVEMMFRGGEFPFIDDIDNNILDLKNLIYNIDKDNLNNYSEYILNPIFGIPQLIGADGDLILDGCLIEIKTVKKHKRNYFYQLIGYYTLNQIIDEPYKIDEIGIYFSRYSQLIKVKIEDLIDLDKFDEFKNWFYKIIKKRARNELLDVYK